MSAVHLVCGARTLCGQPVAAVPTDSDINTVTCALCGLAHEALRDAVLADPVAAAGQRYVHSVTAEDVFSNPTGWMR